MTPILVGCVFPPGVPAAARQRVAAEILAQAGRCGLDPQLVQVLGCGPEADENVDEGCPSVSCLVSATLREVRAHPGMREARCLTDADQGRDQPWSLIRWDAWRRHLELRRDPLGVAPLYYGVTTVAGTAAAATATGAAAAPLAVACSSLALLARIMPALAGVSELAIADQLLGTFAPAHATIYRDLCAVPPGWTVIIGQDGQVQRQRWWHLPDAVERASDRQVLTAREHATISETLLAHLRRAIGSALTAAPTASWLSGGLDSSTVTALAAAALASSSGFSGAGAGGGGGAEAGTTPSLATVSLRFPGMPGADEGPYLAAFHRQVATTRHEMPMQGIDPLAHLTDLARACGQPLLMGNSVYSWMLAQTSAAIGCRSVLTGHDGDSVFGYRTMHLGDLVRQGQIGRALGTWALMAHHHCLPRRRLFTDSIWSPLLLRFRQAMGRQPRMPRHQTAALADVLERTGAWGRAEAQWAGLAQHAVSARDEHYRELTSASLAQATTFFAHLGQAHGIAIRHPLLDVRLVEFCHGLPASAMNHRGWTRYALRQALAGILPEELRWRRRKADLSQPLYRALSENGQGTARTLLTAPGLRPYVRPEGLESLLRSLAATPWQQLDDESLPGIWNLLWLGAWLPTTVSA